MDRDISGAIRQLHEIIDRAISEAAPPEEQPTTKSLVSGSLLLLEGLLIDINRIACAMEAKQK